MAALVETAGRAPARARCWPSRPAGCGRPCGRPGSTGWRTRPTPTRRRCGRGCAGSRGDAAGAGVLTRAAVEAAAARGRARAAAERAAARGTGGNVAPASLGLRRAGAGADLGARRWRRCSATLAGAGARAAAAAGGGAGRRAAPGHARRGAAVPPAGRLGPGWLLTREAAAMAPPVPARPGALWDGRFRLDRRRRPAGGRWRSARSAGRRRLATAAGGAAALPAAVLAHPAGAVARRRTGGGAASRLS